MRNSLPTIGCEKPEPSGKILDIERLRGLAIASVVFLHLSLSASLFQGLGLNPKNMPFWIEVELFFVISGYVVTKSFTAKSMSLRQFFLRRILRLWPTLAVFFVLTFSINLVAPAYAWTPWRELVRGSLGVLAGVYTLIDCPSYYFGAMWSLSVEEQFYLALPALMVLFAWEWSSDWRAAFRRFALVFGVVLVATRCVFSFAPQVGYSSFPVTLGYLARSKFDFIAAGVVLYLLTSGKPLFFNLNQQTQRALMIAGLVVPHFVIYSCGSPFDDYPASPWLSTFGLGVAGAAFTLVVGLAAGDRDLLRLPGWADRIWLYLGSRSYGIYVLHFPLFVVGWIPINAFMPWVFYLKSPLWYGLIQAVVTLPIILIVAELSYRFVERPCIRLSARLAHSIHHARSVPLALPASVILQRAG